MPYGVRSATAPESSRRTSYQKPLIEPVQNKVAIFEDGEMVMDAVLTELSKRLPGLKLTHTHAVKSAEESMSIFIAEMPRVVITDLCLTESVRHLEGFEILAMIRRIKPDTWVALSSSIYTPDGVNSPDRLFRRLNRKAVVKDFDAVFQKADMDGISAFIRAHLDDPLH